ncbi:WXG100 family type VII secretion target [Micromonospora sp. NPDC049366]|uniref:WXG100 family type VII secretion target n=1 Tax=Micromonospora sp. NPDC049366 TaxID=3364271 RepID=UPI003794444A
MPEGFGITYDVVLDAANRLRAENARLNGVVDRMEATARARFAGWSAMSEGTYVQVANTWGRQAGVMHADLEASIQRLLQRVANYQDADRRAAQI